MWDSEIKSMLNILIIPKIHHDTPSAWNVSNTLKLDTTGIPTSEYQYANKAPLLFWLLSPHAQIKPTSGTPGFSTLSVNSGMVSIG